MDKSNVRHVRLAALVFGILFLLFLLFKVFFEQSKNFGPQYVPNSTLIFVLWIIIILFSLTFLFIFIRNIVKIFFDKSSDRLFRGFKNRLVFFFVSFSIVPTLMMFFFASDTISRSIDRWFRPDIEGIMRSIEGVENGYFRKVREDLEHFSRLLATEVQSQSLYTQDKSSNLSNMLQSKMAQYRLDVVSIYKDTVEHMTFINPNVPVQEFKDLPADWLHHWLAGGNSQPKVDNLSKGEMFRYGVSFVKPDNTKILVIAGVFLPEQYVQSLRVMGDAMKNYSQQRFLRDPIKNTIILLFIFVTILIIFSASWIGLFLARGITTPIDKLAAATSEIARGNLDIHIDYTAKNEFNVLITEFYRMASVLKENRDKLNKRTLELRHRRTIIETILRNITSGVIALNPRGEIININPEAARMLGAELEAAVHKHFSQIIPVTGYADLHQLIVRAFESKFKIVDREVDLKTRGKIINLAVKITQIRNPRNNRFNGLLVVLTDLSDLIKAQRMLVWREVAKRVAHEIKNPLTPIQISAQRILRSLDQPDDKFRAIVEDSLNIIQQELDSIKGLAEEFGNFARLPEIKFTQGDINEILEKLAAVYTSVYQNMEFQVKLSEELPALVKLDVEQIKRVFVNLLDNAVESMNRQGRIEVLTRYNKESQFITVEIADEGPGVSDEDKTKLFMPYFSKKSSGRGLGLAIVTNIIEEHNGQISVVDNQPRGARFVVELPA